MSRLKIIVLGLLALTLSSCESNNRNAETNVHLTLAIESDISNLNPWVNNSVNANDIFGLIYTSLFREVVRTNELSRFEPDWVKSIKFESDSLTLVLQLRKDVYWSDGVRASAFDVEFSHKMLSSDSTGIYRSSKENIQSVSAPDSFTLVVRYKSRSLYQLMDLNDGYILPAHVFKGQSVLQIKQNESYKSNPVTNGKYRITSRVPNNEIRLVRTEKSDEPFAVTEVVFKITADPFVRINMLKNGTVNLLPNISFNQLDAFSDTSLFRIQSTLYPSTEYIIFNLENPVFKNAGIRKFISASLEKKEIVKTALGDEGEILNTVFPNGFWTNDTGYTHSGMTSLSDTEKYLSKLKSKAFRLKIASTNEARVRAGYEIKKQLSAHGIDIKLELLPMDVLAKEVRSGNYEMAIWGTKEGTKPNLSLRYFQSGIGTTNLTRYNNPEFERIHKLASDQFNKKQSLHYWSVLQKMLLDESIIVPLFQRKKLDVFLRDIIHSESNTRSVLNNLDRWKISHRDEK